MDKKSNGTTIKEPEAEQLLVEPGQAFFENRIQTEWMTIEQAAEYLQCKVSFLRDLVYKREIPHSKLGKLLRFHQSTLDQWLLTEKGR